MKKTLIVFVSLALLSFTSASNAQEKLQLISGLKVVYAIRDRLYVNESEVNSSLLFGPTFGLRYGSLVGALTFLSGSFESGNPRVREFSSDEGTHSTIMVGYDYAVDLGEHSDGVFTTTFLLGYRESGFYRISGPVLGIAINGVDASQTIVIATNIYLFAGTHERESELKNDLISEGFSKEEIGGGYGGGSLEGILGYKFSNFPVLLTLGIGLEAVGVSGIYHDGFTSFTLGVSYVR